MLNNDALDRSVITNSSNLQWEFKLKTSLTAKNNQKRNINSSNMLNAEKYFTSVNTNS